MSRRSDYFSTMLGSNFQEGSTASGDILEIQVADAQPEVLYAALRWVYTDRVDADMPAEQLLQVIYLCFQHVANSVHSKHVKSACRRLPLEGCTLTAVRPLGIA